MHELSVTESLLDIAIRHGASENARRVRALYLVVGDLSSIVDESVRFYWDFVSRGTIAEGADLHFRRVVARMACLTCGQEYEPRGEVLACPSCGGSSAKVIAGEEFHLEAMDIETDESGCGQPARTVGGGGT